MTTTKKSLNEQINDVLSNKGSRKAKCEAIIKLGVSANDANLLCSIWDKEHKTVKGTYTFGVEIECYVNYENVRANGIMFEHQSYNHRDSRKVFKFVHDGSVIGNINGVSGIECVTPVLDAKTSGFKALKKCCDALNEQGARTNKNCGLHVHIGAADLSEEAYANVFANYLFCEQVIDSFMAKSRRGSNNTYTKSLIGKGVQNAYNRMDTQKCFTNGRIPTSDMWRSPYRYYKVNAMAWFGHKTIEFRQHGQTTDYKKISEWVKFCVALVDWSKKNRLTHFIRSIDEIPFLNKAQKDFFKARKTYFENR